MPVSNAILGLWAAARIARSCFGVSGTGIPLRLPSQRWHNP